MATLFPLCSPSHTSERKRSLIVLSKLSVDSPPNSPLPMMLFECSSSLGIAQPSGDEREREREREEGREKADLQNYTQLRQHEHIKLNFSIHSSGPLGPKLSHTRSGTDTAVSGHYTYVS